MTELSNALLHSVFRKESYKAAIGDEQTNGYAVIRITPTRSRLGDNQKDPSIVGVMKENLTLSVKSNWSELGDNYISNIPFIGGLSEVYRGVSKWSALAGASPPGQGYFSRKIYSGGDYLTISPSMRVVNWHDDGQPMKSAMLACFYALPSNILKTDELYKKIKDGIKRGIFGAIEKFEMSEPVEGILSDPFGKIKNNLSNMFGEAKENTTIGTAAEAFNADFLTEENLATLRSSPVPVEVSIGQYFQNKDMVIESVEVEFSKEMTRTGPLYVDISMSLSSRQHVQTLDEMGMLVPKEGRVNIKDIKSFI